MWWDAWDDRASLRRAFAMESWRRARAQYAAVVAERDALRRECDALERDAFRLERELADITARHRELHASVLARYEAWEELARLHREHEIDRARKAERDPAMPLH